MASKYAALHEDDVAPKPSKYAALHDEAPAIPGVEYGLAFQKVGAPDEPQERIRSLLDRAKSAGLGFVHGTAQNLADEGAGVSGAVIDKLFYGSEKPLLNLYEENRDHARKFYKDARAEDPTAFGVGDLGGSVVSGIAMSPALPGGAMASTGRQLAKQGAIQGTIAGFGASEADTFGGMALDTAVGTAIGTGAGAAAPYIAKGIGAGLGALRHPIETGKVVAGELAQVPQKVYEKGAELIGKTGIAQKMAGVADMPRSGMASSAVRALRNMKDAATYGGGELGKAVNGAVEKLGNAADQIVATLGADDLKNVAAKMSELFNLRGAKEVTPEMVVKNLDSLASLGGLDLSEATVGDLVRLVNKRDVAYQVKSLAGSGKFWGEAFGADKVSPKVNELLSKNSEVLSDMGAGTIDRLGRPGSPAGQVGQFRIKDMETLVPDAANQIDDVAVAMEAGKGNLRLTEGGGFEIGKNADQNGIKNFFLQQRARDEAKALAQNVLADDAVPSGAVAAARQAEKVAAAKRISSGEAFQEADQAASNEAFRRFSQEKAQQMTAEQAASAAEKLRNIATGRKFLEKRALPVIGAVGGAGMGGAPGAAAGLALGLTPRAGDLVSEFGQYLANSGRENLAKTALKHVNNPGFLRQLSQRQDQIGSGARWALQGVDDASTFAVRSFVLASQPGFRAMLSDEQVDAALPQ